MIFLVMVASIICLSIIGLAIKEAITFTATSKGIIAKGIGLITTIAILVLVIKLIVEE